MKTRLGRHESAMLAYLQLRKKRTAKAGELIGPLGLSPAQESELFRRMLRGKLIARVRPGLFLVPTTLPLGGAWTPTPAHAMTALMEDRNGRYQICGPNAFNRYGLDDQVPNRTVAAARTQLESDRNRDVITRHAPLRLNFHASCSRRP